MANLALGKPYTKSHTPSTSYPDTNNAEFTDGIEGTSVSDGKSFGYQYTQLGVANGAVATLEITVDLGVIAACAGAKLTSGGQANTSKYHADVLEILTSVDGTAYTSQGSVGTLNSPQRYLEVKFSQVVEARYVRFRIQKDLAPAGQAGDWLFIDEGYVFGEVGLASAGTVLEPHSDLASSGSVAATGTVAIRYEVLPVGISNLPCFGTVANHASLQSSGEVAAHGSILLSYEVFERPKVTVTLTPVADAFVLDAEPTLNYGDTMDLVIGRYDSRKTRAVLRFDLSSLRTDLADLIVSAYLRLTNRIVKGQGQLEAHEALSPWNEYGVTWANQPPRHPTVLDKQPMAARVDLNILPLFMGWYRQTKANNGVIVMSADEAAVAHVVAASREWVVGADRPQLLVTYYMPEGLPGTSTLPSSGVVGQSSLYSTGIIFGVFVDLPSRGKVSQPHLLSYGHVFIESSLQSSGSVRGTRVSFDTPSAGTVSRPDISASGFPRAWADADLQGAGYVYERNDLPSSATPRLTWYDDLPGDGYVAHAANELESRGVVDGYYDDLPSSGSPRVWADSDLPSSGDCPKGGPQDLASTGKVTGQWMRSSGIVAQVVDFWSRGQVRITIDLPSTGFIYYIGASDLGSNGWPQVRDADDLPSSGWCRAHHSDLPSSGHIGPWLFEVRTTVKIWPPEGRSVR